MTLCDLGVADEGRGVVEVNSDNLSTVFDADISCKKNSLLC